MSYATIADLVSRFGEDQLIQLTDRAGTGELDEAVAEQALADASALADGYLASRHSVPLSPVPAILTGYVCDLARARLYPDASLNADHPVRLRERDALRFLEHVGSGKLTLGVTPGPSSSNTVQVVTQDRRRHGVGL